MKDTRVYLEENSNGHSLSHFSERNKVEAEVLKFNDLETNQFNYIKKGQINSQEVIKEILDYNPTLIITYGCSILTDDFINSTPGNKINVHLGLSPYYRGTATNFWPIYNHEMQYCGVTFHKLSRKVDAGDIYGQYSLEKKYYKSIHHVGNSLIKLLPANMLKIIKNIKTISTTEQFSNKFFTKPRRYYRKKDFNETHSDYVLKNFRTINNKFLKEKSVVPIIKLPK